MARKSPLTPDHYRQIQAALRGLADKEHLCRQCEQIDMDMSQINEQREFLKGKLEKIKSVFFPGHEPGSENLPPSAIDRALRPSAYD